MASYLDNKHSPTVKSLSKLNFVVSPEDKTNTQLGNAVINDIRELATLFLGVVGSACFTDCTARLFCILLEKLFSRSLMGGCLRVCFNFVSILSFTFGFFQAFFSFVLSLFSLQALKQPPLMILETVFPIGCRKAGPYNQ
jgi:hypothetical protein